jgi:hypothetical protein
VVAPIRTFPVGSGYAEHNNFPLPTITYQAGLFTIE